MKNYFVYLLTALFISTFAFSQGNAWTINSHTVSFKIKNAKVNVDGKFDELKATFNFDANKLTTSSINANVKINSIKTGIDMRDRHLKKKEYFDAETFPEMSLKTLGIIKLGENQFGAKCQLTIKGKTKELEIPFIMVDNKNGTATFNSTFKLNRLDFGVGSSSIIMSNDLTVFLVIVVAKNKS
jgi:polyisoprenoid-binding protein YceI